MPTIAVLLPTKNGEKYLKELLTSVSSQVGNFASVDIIGVDSGSSDETRGIIAQYGGRVICIAPEQFGHGRTRNLVASKTRAEYLVFLTQDATPANSEWLRNLIAPLLSDVNIAGAYSRHLPRADCHPMEWRRIVQHEPCGKVTSSVSEAIDPGYRKEVPFVHFFSNVSSVLRRDIWERFPFPEVDYGEDQLWARLVLGAGYKIAYQADSLVCHSHGYGVWNNLRRHFDHGRAAGWQGQISENSALYGILSAVSEARKDVEFWQKLTKRGRAEILWRWGWRALAWHFSGKLGAYLGGRYARLPFGVVRRFSLHESIKRS